MQEIYSIVIGKFVDIAPKFVVYGLFIVCVACYVYNFVQSRRYHEAVTNSSNPAPAITITGSNIYIQGSTAVNSPGQYTRIEKGKLKASKRKLKKPKARPCSKKNVKKS